MWLMEVVNHSSRRVANTICSLKNHYVDVYMALMKSQDSWLSCECLACELHVVSVETRDEQDSDHDLLLHCSYDYTMYMSFVFSKLQTEFTTCTEDV